MGVISSLSLLTEVQTNYKESGRGTDACESIQERV